MGESGAREGFRHRRAAVYGLLFLAAVILPLWVTALDPGALATSYGKRFVPFELMGATFSFALATVALFELRAFQPLTWRSALPVILPLLLALDTVTFFSELARKPFDYDCYEYAGRALLLGEDPYRVGLNYLYPPLVAQIFVAAARGADWAARAAGFSPAEDSVWDAVFYLYQCAQIGLVIALFFLVRHLARVFGLAEPWASLLVAGLLFFDNPLLRTLRHGQVNLWVLDLSLLCLIAAKRRPCLAGAALATAAHVKIYPLVLLLPLLSNRAWQSMLWTGAALAGIVALQTELLTDFTLWQQYGAFLAGTYPGEFAFRNASFHSLAVNTLRFGFGVGPGELQSEVRFAASLFSLAMVGWLMLRVGRRFRADESGRSRLYADGADALAFSLLISQSTWEHHYVFAIPLMIRAVASRGREAPLGVAAAGFLALWMPTFDLFPISYHRAVGLVGLLWLTRPGRAAKDPVLHEIGAQVGLAALSLGGVRHWSRPHSDGANESASERM